MAVSATALPKKNTNNLHVEEGHPSETITHTTAKAPSIQVTGTFKPFEDCALGKVRQQAVSKRLYPDKKIRGKTFL